jgi:hypothetical protein
LRVDVPARGVTLSAAQQRVADAAPDATIALTGPPASGKTTALAGHYLQSRRAGRNALVICSHPSGVRAFYAALNFLQAAQPADRTAPGNGTIDTLAQHVARWMRGSYVAARAAPQLRIGDQAATRAIVERAARGLLDMSWPLFVRRQLNLDLPHLSRPDAFLEEAASLITLLQRARIGPDEFEDGCNAGLAAFYGENVERAVSLLHDPLVRERASQRGRDACRVPATTLALQRTAERDVALILAQLYREYLNAAAQADLRSPEDVVDAAIRWLSHDESSAREIASGFTNILVDDAEDGEPGLSPLLTSLQQASGCGLIVAGWERGRVDGLEGRRSSLALAENGERIALAPLGSPATMHFERLADEAAEVAWLAARLDELLAHGVPPDEIALLCRGADTAAGYARRLRERGIPIALPPEAFENENELLDLLSLCAIVRDPYAAAQMLRVLSSPLLGFSDATVWTLCRDPLAAAQLALPVGEPVASSSIGAGGVTLANNVLSGAADPLLSEPQRDTLARFRRQLTEWRNATHGFTPAQLLGVMTQAAGFADRWQQAPAYARERLADDVERLAEAMVVASASESIAIAAAVERFQRGMLFVRPAQPSAGAIGSYAIAGAKGLRWTHVFVAGVAHERFPRVYTSHAIAFSRSWGLIVRENVARGPAQTAKYAWYYAKFGAKTMYLDEERRALHYGLSRASTAAAASGYGSPPRWARDQDLLATLPNGTS